MRRLVVGIIASAVLLAGCAVPRHRSTTVVDEPAISSGRASAMLVRFNRVRSRADAGRDRNALAAVEGGALLAVDTGLYHVSTKLSPRRTGARGPWTSPTQLFVPRFTRYPLWYVAMVEDTGQGTGVAAVFTRTSVTTPWQVVLAPQFAATTRLPAVRTVAGDEVSLAMTRDAGLVGSPDSTVDRLCAVLGDAGSRFTGEFASDSFIRQMRRLQARSGRVRISQQWTRLPGGHALRTADGGALVVVSVRREDRYRVVRGTIEWPRDNPAAAFQPGPVRGSSTLRYLHQLLIYIPPRGRGDVRLLGQAGGIIGAHR